MATYADSIKMSDEELQEHPEVEMCQCAHTRELHQEAGLIQYCKGTHSYLMPPSSTHKCTCPTFTGAGQRLKNSLISQPDTTGSNSKEVRIETPTTSIHSSVDAADAPSPSQNVGQAHGGVCTCPHCCPEKWAANAAIQQRRILEQAQAESITGHDGSHGSKCTCLACRPDLRPSSAWMWAGQGQATADGGRWAQQDELNLANARVIDDLRRKIAASDLTAQIEARLTDAIHSSKRELDEQMAEMQAVITGINKRVNNTPASTTQRAADDIKQKWAELQCMLNQRFQAMQDHNHALVQKWMNDADSNYMTGVDAYKRFDYTDKQLTALRVDLHDVRLMAEHPLHVAIGSDVPAAAAPPSPEYDEFQSEMAVWKQKVEHILNTRFANIDKAAAACDRRMDLIVARIDDKCEDLLTDIRRLQPPAGDSITYGSAPRNGPVGAPKVAVSGAGAWIACSERMPPANDIVLVYTPSAKEWRIDTDRWDPSGEWYIACGGQITHWQPLPAPPPTTTI